MERHGDSQVSQRVREEITKGLPRGEPRREDIARALHLSERTLQRRLHDEGSSFQELLEDTRRDLARRYLRQRQLPLAEAAYLLGFAEQSTFQRACRRWFATSPHKYRKQATARPALA
jgi:AraC-like DNA-binding protein